jgi:hypothetical protein
VALVYFRDSHVIVTRSIFMDIFIDRIMRDFSLPPPCRYILLEYYAAQVGNAVPTFQDNLSVPSLRLKESESPRLLYR